jgi:hypothetical protein
MSANKKARDKMWFDIATVGKVLHPTHSQVTSANKQKKDRKRAEQRKINLSKFKREPDRKFGGE